MRIGLILLTALLIGCLGLDRRIVEPPATNSRAQARIDTLLAHYQIGAEHFQSPAGHRLSYIVTEARDYRLDYAVAKQERTFSYRLRPSDPEQLGPVREPQGTIVFLHGWSMAGVHLLPWALRMGELGWRGVSLDLRHHGRSEPAPVGYGAREVEDVLALLDELEHRELLQPPLIVFGTSLGAATAIHAGNRAAQRIAAVVAVEPYANAAEGIASSIAGLLAHGSSNRWRERVLRRAFALRYNPERIEAAIDRASKRIGLDLRSIDVAAELQALPQCVLHVHGARDTLIPVESARELARANPRTVYVELPEDGHFSTVARADWLAEPLAAWLPAATTARPDQPCPPFQLPPDPAFDGWPDDDNEDAA